MEDKVLLSYFGGVGDNLQFSTLPKRFSELGYKVYLSTRAQFRNPEIKTLVWDNNPYILGLSGAEPNCGDGAGVILEHKTNSFLGNWEIAHGLAPTGKYPELYYDPKLIKDVSDKILVDLTSVSGQPYYEPEILSAYFHQNYPREEVLACVFQDGIGYSIVLLGEYEMIFVTDIFHYCDLIHSCKKFVVLHSGGMVIASALKKYGDIDVDCIVTNHPIHTNGLANHHHFYDNINYIWL